MIWEIITNHYNCQWLYVDRTGVGINKICGHAESESRYCQEETCPIKHRPKRRYEKYEYCKAVDCHGISNASRCCLKDGDCDRTAKEFHIWIEENGFEIVKAAKDYSPDFDSDYDYMIGKDKK